MRLERNPNYNKFQLPKGYRDLGWQRHSGECDEIANCVKLGHNKRKNKDHWREFDNSLYMHRCTDVIKICDACKIIWHIDMSD